MPVVETLIRSGFFVVGVWSWLSARRMVAEASRQMVGSVGTAGAVMLNAKVKAGANVSP